jgi:hypothetical protein
MSATKVLDCRPANYDSLPADQKKIYLTPEEVEEQVATISGHIAIACQVEGFEDVAVATTHPEIEEMLKMFMKNKKHAKCVFAGTFREIIKHRGKTDELYHKGGVEWDNFCNDIVLWTAARCVLLNKPIPILNNLPKDACLGEKFKGNPADMPRVSSLPSGVGIVNTIRNLFSPDVVSATIVEDDDLD